MPECPIADECPSFEEQIEGMGCQHYGDRGGMEWCQHYNVPIEELKTAPVVPGEEVVVTVTDMHESGAGVGHHADSGFVVMVDGVLPEVRVRAKITSVKSNYARADLLEKLPEEESDDEEDADDAVSGEESGEDEGESSSDSRRGPKRERLGSRENFWGN
ncbi:TRAM domain-containing protein [Halocalculus aciditolerans]|uniref:Deoxyribonuclease n=1 Tax=Halocalculus aciditolerans TaxID=1383812 RepID=A0A830F7W4_9EURY|nr:TRAM domain-containing protein [Halocalculus aciditolerans]GGL49225.1 deoxyribonuclease [Halocalculus aciditolerans]